MEKVFYLLFGIYYYLETKLQITVNVKFLASKIKSSTHFLLM